MPNDLGPHSDSTCDEALEMQLGTIKPTSLARSGIEMAPVDAIVAGRRRGSF